LICVILQINIGTLIKFLFENLRTAITSQSIVWSKGQIEYASEQALE